MTNIFGKYFFTALYFLFQSLVQAQSGNCIFNNFGTIVLQPDMEINGQGDNIDSMEFWKAPDSSETLLFVTAKDNHLVEVWKYPFTGNELQPLIHQTFNNGQVNGIIIDQAEDLLYISIGSPVSTISVFSLPDLSFISNFSRNGANYFSEPNLALLEMPGDEMQLYVSMDNRVDIHEPFSGQYISSFNPVKPLETLAADNYYQKLYIPDESTGTGIYCYSPDGLILYTNFGDGYFESDAEGIFVYHCMIGSDTDNGEGFIVVADQRTDLTDFEFFDRVSNEYLGTMNITGISNTDGIASFRNALPDYPLGLFAAINSDSSVAFVSWEKIFNAIEAKGGLPVELKNFRATIRENIVFLEWETYTETNNYGFEVQRRKSGWETIGFVEGNGSSFIPQYYSFADTLNADSTLILTYRLKQIDTDGVFTYSELVSVRYFPLIEFNLDQNYPNPFNPKTVISYQLPVSKLVTLKIYDILGSEVETLVNEEKPAGTHEVIFDAESLGSGIYFYRLTAGDYVSTRKMLLLK